jgi:hypothetical protein
MKKRLAAMGFMATGLIVSVAGAQSVPDSKPDPKIVLANIQKDDGVRSVMDDIVPLGQLTDKLHRQIPLAKDDCSDFVHLVKRYKVEAPLNLSDLLKRKRGVGDQKMVLAVCRRLFEAQQGDLERHIALLRELEAQVRGLGPPGEAWIQVNRKEIEKFTQLSSTLAAIIVDLVA